MSLLKVRTCRVWEKEDMVFRDTLAKTEIIYPINFGAQVAMYFT